MTTPDPSREAFEKHVLTENGIYVRGIGWISRNEHGDYVATDTQRRWLTWQAAKAHRCASNHTEPHPPTRHCMCSDCAPSFNGDSDD
ncbi:hypothetical protein HNP33_004224 [Comamonas odontotermitis]|uniref:Uncharacterized protein n=1 Tax=Comamonas odontotermitis TaxID=379895 RepID=A0ABR6RM29_9BURK|nr:hypothetical protein [Comamonas odontotermitis]